MDNNLKNYDRYISYWILFNITIFFMINFDYLQIDFIYLRCFLSSMFIFFPVFVINNIISSDFKFKVLYPNKINNHLASEIFTKLSSGEIDVDKNYIDLELIFDEYGGFPNSPNDEDKLWFSIYRKYREVPKILNQHQIFLLERDFASVIFPVAFLMIIVSFYFKIPIINVFFIVIMCVIEFFIFRYLATKQNEKLILSVLQEESFYLKGGFDENFKN